MIWIAGIVAVLSLSFLILAHEIGHFFVAQWTGMKVEEFGFGYPPRLFSYRSKKNGIEYSINWIPFGGFVKIKGEDGESGEGSFKEKSFSKKSAVILAGVAMNLLIAILLFGAVHILGSPSVIEDNNTTALNPYVQIADVVPDSPADVAGMKMGDIIEKINVDNNIIDIKTVGMVQDIVSGHKGEQIDLLVSREGENLEIPIIPRAEYPDDEGAMGVGLVRAGLVKTVWYKVPMEALRSTWDLTKLIFIFLGDMIVRLFTKGQVPADVMGPVGIVAMSGQIASMGFSYVLWVIAMVSLNLFLINLFPLPALDGGRMLFMIIEKIKGSPINQKIEQWIHLSGFVILIVLAVLITARDVVRLF
ncbi:RIP metalloprotease RseP [bacterium]|nr:MAG: RIP metalloprotease RseP [bacterium]